jgi:hypothetical protein
VADQKDRGTLKWAAQLKFKNHNKEPMRLSLFKLSFCTGILTIFSFGSLAGQDLDYPVSPPKNYVCYTAQNPIVIDGALHWHEWEGAGWTDAFIDILGPEGKTPFFATRVKMLWDSNYFYFGTILEEPHVWGTLTERDAIIYFDNDFEIFIDPDGDNHNYMELEINALNTLFDLFLKRPYRDTTRAEIEFDMPNVLSAVTINGTLNDPSDKDQNWGIEIAIPWTDMMEYLPGKRIPRDQEQWRINFSRVHWETDIIDGKYVKKKDANGKPQRELNWVWSPQWAVNMHQPEFWGYVQFSDSIAGSSEVEFREDVDFDLKMALVEVYKKQKEFFQIHKRYTENISNLKLDFYNVKKFGNLLEIKVNKNTFTAKANGLKAIWKINERSHLTFQDYLN